jgi:hypothetical protein
MSIAGAAMTDADARFEAEIDRQRAALLDALAALPNGGDVAATPFAALIVFWETARPLVAAGGEPVRRRFRNALECVIADVVPEMLRPPTEALEADVAAAPVPPARRGEFERLADALLASAQATETSSSVRAFAALAAAAHLSSTADLSPTARTGLVAGFVAAARHLHPSLVVIDATPPLSGQTH